ncbi:BTAD domain-containing putative transcriptional regulator [Streptomyces sp. 11x1]|uniref:AfsR/SARP family transcriptional regulator n=1 Tax=Streptomyces sp. 11x1 TaxID=3038642 RepID=UPI0029309F36|nr:BTAD domain-containing putative transcriptional regulator [Streptomyces sp. 11x1]WNZ14264.1 BTAD domain-containing putative transcriptional regulator [Streptomyces sp. 11x1]
MPTTDSPVFRVLGPLEVTGASGAVCRIPRGRQQVVLSALLLEANRVVSTESLVDAIWGDAPPATARTQVQTCVSALRTNLAVIGEHTSLLTREPGYAMEVTGGRLDAALFSRYRKEAHEAAESGSLEEAAALTRRAADLWRGPALSGTRSHKLQSMAAQLDEYRLINLETYADLELRLGRHARVVPELSALVAEYPLREGLRARLMLALYRSARQAEALEVFRAGRAILVDQLGIEPGDELRRLESAILAGDPELRHPDADSVPGIAPVTPAPDPASAPTPAAEPPEPSGRVVPFQLPPDNAHFTGRVSMVATAKDVLLAGGESRPTPVLVLAGPSGVGKSTIAVHLGHRLMHEFPDGQFYCDLADAGSSPATALDALGRFLRAMGIPGAQIPEPLDERAEMYRSLLAGQRTLIVLDNASSSHQVRHLLPGNGTSSVIVTGRSGITGLPGARSLYVDVFDPEESIEMLAAVVGADRVAAEPDAAQDLVRMVGRLPLALRIIAARLAARPNWSLEWMRDRLSDERRRLDELSHGELVVRSSLALTYDGLTEACRRLLRLLSLQDGGSVPTWVAAALLDTDLYSAGDLLESLVDAQMLEIDSTGAPGEPHYRLQSLVRLFAREELERYRDEDGADLALTRLVGGWLALADEAHRRLYGGDFAILHGQAPRWHMPGAQVDQLLRDPMGWLENERANLCHIVDLSAAAGQTEACWNLAVTLVTMFESRCYFDDWQRTHEKALEATSSAGLLRGRAAIMCSMGSLCLTRAQFTAARALLEPAQECFASLHDTHGLALTRRNLALLAQRQGDEQAALALHRQAVADFQAVGDLVGQTNTLAHLARLALEQGCLDDAENLLDEALDISQHTGSRRMESQVRFVMSDLMQRRGRYQEAEGQLRGVLELVRSRGDIAGESRTLHRLGTVNACLGRISTAQRLLNEVLAIRERTMDRVGAAEVRLELAQLEAEHSAHPPYVGFGSSGTALGSAGR